MKEVNTITSFISIVVNYRSHYGRDDTVDQMEISFKDPHEISSFAFYKLSSLAELLKYNFVE